MKRGVINEVGVKEVDGVEKEKNHNGERSFMLIRITTRPYTNPDKESKQRNVIPSQKRDNM